MKGFRIFLAALLLLPLCLFSVFAKSAVPKRVLSAAQSVVRISVEDKDGYASGSGFVVFSDRDAAYIATNEHVVAGAPFSISVWLSESEKISATVFASRPQKDLCILKLSTPILLTPLVLNTQNYKQGDAVYAAGFPGASDVLSDTEARISKDATITDGIISAVRQMKVVEYGSPVELLQISAAINSGNSGGPLFNDKGEVIGINSYGVYDSQGIFGAISSRELDDLMNEMGISAAFSPHTFVIVLLAVILVLALLVFLMVLFKRRSRKTKAKSKRITLNEYVKEAGPFSIPEAVSLLLPVSEQLNELHKLGMAYLEISPARIVIAKDKALLLPKEGSGASQPAVGFTAPEIYRGIDYGNSSDIYSLCAVLFFMLTGTIPEHALLRVDPPEDLPLSLSEGLETGSAHSEIGDILLRGMALDPADRFDTIEELQSRLSPFHSEISGSDVKAAEKKEAPVGGCTPARRISPLLAIPAAVIALALLVGGLYYGSYLRAVSLAEDGRFSKAEKYLICEPLTKLHDELFPSYLEAGVLFENREYSAAMDWFMLILDYRDSSTMYQEAKYFRAAQLADQGNFSAAIGYYKNLASIGYKDSLTLIKETQFRKAIYDLYEENDYLGAYDQFRELSRSGYSKADNMMNEAVYVWACALMDDGDLVGAYKKFEEIKGYEDVDSALRVLRDAIYAEGQSAYWDDDLVYAAECFQAIEPYSDSESYLVLLQAIYYGERDYSFDNRLEAFISSAQGQEPPSIFYGLKPVLGSFLFNSDEEAVNALEGLFYFEDAADILVEYEEYACLFLRGTWKDETGNYYFTMNDDESTVYNLPWFDYGDYYTIINGDYLLYEKGKEDKARPMFNFYPLTPNSISVYCYKDGSSITIYRQ